MKKTLAALAIALLPSLALAQSNPGLTYKQVPTAGQWNSYFSAKQDVLGFTPLNTAGGTMSGRLVTAAPGATVAGLNLTPGTAPGSPANGDLWVTTTGLYAQVNGTTIGPMVGATSGSFAATTPLSVSFPAGVTTYACATCGVTTSPLSQFAATTSAQLLGVLSDESGSGLAVFNNAPTLIAPVLGAATATSINKVTITAPATSAILTIANGKTLTASNTLTFTGTDGTSFGFPGTSDTVVTLGATQTLAAKTFTTPILGVATASSLAIGGATLGANALAVTGSSVFSGAMAIASASANALAVGPNGTTNPTFQVDASTVSAATGIKITAFAATGGTNLAAISSGTNENLGIDAKGSGTITIAGNSTGALTLSRATTLSGALTYGGVTLTNAVTGTGNMVLSAGATLTGTLTMSGQAIHTGTSAPSSAAGNSVVLGTLSTPPTLSNNGQAFLYNTTSGGAILQGAGSSFDLILMNKSGTAALTVPTGTGTVSLPSLSAGSCVSGVLALDGSSNVVKVTCPFSGTAALGTSAISSATCATVVTVAASGVATTDTVTASFNGDPTAVTGYVPSTSGMLSIFAYPTANNVNFKVCNNTGSSITPGAITLNWRVTR